MAIKKSQLYSTLWESCNALRGSMDASQYKDYVLMILFGSISPTRPVRDRWNSMFPTAATSRTSWH